MDNRFEALNKPDKFGLYPVWDIDRNDALCSMDSHESAARNCLSSE